MGADNHASAHSMVADLASPDILFDNTLPIPFAEDVMPVAAIAADLAVSSTTHERSRAFALGRSCCLLPARRTRSPGSPSVKRRGQLT